MMLLDKGNLIKNVNNTKVQEEYTMRLMSLDELNSVVELQNYVYEQLPNKRVLYRDTYEDMHEDLLSGGKIIGVFNEKNRLIAYRYISFPGENNKNLGYDIKLPETQLDKVVHLETTVVHNDYRGNGLQSLTLQHATSLTKSLGYRHLLCTVSPQNFYSLYNVMKNGLKIKALKRKYGTVANQKDGLWRFILHRDMEVVSYLNPIEFFTAKLDNIEEQKRLIEEGYIGYNVLKESRMLNYARFNDYAVQQ